MNAKIFRHTAFWIAISIQGTLLQYSWLPASLVNGPHGNLVWLSAQCNMMVMPLKMVFTYYTIDTIKKAFLKQERFWVSGVLIASALAAACILHRFIGSYFIAPALFPGRTGSIDDAFSLPLFLISLMDLGYVAGIAAALTLFHVSVVKARKEKTLLKDKLETELKFLKNQINPHFLFNTLNNIYSLSRKKSDRAPEVVMKLSQILRFMLYESGRDWITISEEVKILQDYVALEKIRYNERLSIRFVTEVDNEQQRIAPLILLPFIENAFKHGANAGAGDAWIDIKIVVKESILDFTVSNSKSGVSGSNAETQIGLNNVRRQLELLYTAFSLQTINEPGLFKVLLHINLQSNANM